MPITIYHNPRCSKSRKTLEILEESGAAPRIVRYLDEAPDAARIVELATMIGVPVKALLRDREKVVTEARDLPDPDDGAALAKWIARHPQALQRPIVVSADNERAVVGRPPENVRALIP